MPGAQRGVVPAHVATSIDAPNPEAGEEHPHTNTQLLGTVAREEDRFAAYETMQRPFNAPDDLGREPTMDGLLVETRVRGVQITLRCTTCRGSSMARSRSTRCSAPDAMRRAGCRWNLRFSRTVAL